MYICIYMNVYVCIAAPLAARRGQVGARRQRSPRASATYKTVTARFWPWLAPFFKVLTLFEVVPFSLGRATTQRVTKRFFSGILTTVALLDILRVG